jgi:hypothetical protein
VDGDAYEGNPAEIERVITIVIGSPPDEVPSDFDFNGA